MLSVRAHHSLTGPPYPHVCSQEYANAWNSLLEMRGALHGSRAQAVLARIFGDGEELKAIGAAQQMEKLKGFVPKLVLDLLKNNCAKPLQATHYELMRALEHEKQSINKILRMQQGGVTLLWTGIVSVSIGFSNYFFPRILRANGDGYMAIVFCGVASFVASVYAAMRLLRHYHTKKGPGLCAALACSTCAPCAKKKQRRGNNNASDIAPRPFTSLEAQSVLVTEIC